MNRPTTLILTTSLVLAACNAGEEEEKSDVLEIIGDYEAGGTDNTLETFDIGEDDIAVVFQDGPAAVLHVVDYDNDEAWLLAVGDDANGPGLRSGTWFPFYWVELDDQLYLCSLDRYPNEDEARDEILDEYPDTTKPAQGGCGPYDWTTLTPR